MVVQLISQDILAAVTMKVTHFEFKVEDWKRSSLVFLIPRFSIFRRFCKVSIYLTSGSCLCEVWGSHGGDNEG
jgi:hypothetical protein